MLVVLLYLTPAMGQTVTVVERGTGDPLEGVNIYTPDRSTAVATDNRGQASLAQFTDEQTIIFSYVGFRNLRISYQQVVDRGMRVAMEQNPLAMSQMVVSSNRWTQDTREVPVTIERVSAEEVRLQNPQTAADLLGVSNEVFIQKSQMAGGSPMIRGFATNRVLLVVDGVRMNNAIFRGGNLQNVISLDANAVANTEVMFGPGSVSYGSDAIGGVMNFSTLEPHLSLTGEPRVEVDAMTRVASANWEKTGHVDFNLGFENWGSVTSLTYSDYESMRMGTEGPDDYLRHAFVRRVNGTDMLLDNPRPNIQKPSGYNQINLLQKFRLRPSDAWDIDMGMHYSTTTDLPRYDRLTGRAGNEYPNAEWYYGPQQWLMTNLEATRFSDSQLFDQLNANLAYQDYEESRNDRDFGDPNRRNREEHVYAWSLNLDFEKELSEQSTLFYGLEGVRNKIRSKAHVTNIETGAVSPTSTRYPDDSSWQSYAAFLTYKNTLSDRWTLSAGARYNQYLIDAGFTNRLEDFPFDKAEINRGALTGSAGMVFRPAASWQVNAHVSTGFRAPNIDDIGKIFDSEPGSVIVPNPDLEPEYAYNFEVSIRKVFGERLKMDVAAYHTILDNAMARRDFTLNGRDSVMYDGTLSRVQAIQNVASATVQGLQASMDLQISPTLNLTSHLNFQEGEEENVDGEKVPVRHVAPTFGSTHLTWEPGRLTVDLYADYNGAIPYSDLAPSERGKPHLYALDESGNPYSPSWHTFNLKASYRWRDTLTLHFGLENITDQRYRPYSSGIAAAGRNVIFGLRGHIR